jgi:uncharacterized protein (DUF2336 family)
MVSTLSQQDVARLLADPSTDVRAEVAGKLALEIDSPKLTAGELQIAQDIVRLMAKDAAIAVRSALSQSLRSAKRLPHDVALRLADDIEIVALPILNDSSVLTDADLVAIVGRGSAAKQEAIATRPNVSEAVSDALITSADEGAVTKLMKNATAQISDKSLGKAVDRFAASEAVKESMVLRQHLPVTVAERLVALVSEQLTDYLVSHHELSSALATDLVMQSRERAIMHLRNDSGEADVVELVRQMHRNNRLTPMLVLRALCMGDMDFFTASLAVMAKVPLANARILVNDAGGNGLTSLYAKSGMPERLLPAVRVAVDVVEGTQLDGGAHDLERYRARVLARILTQFEGFDRDDLDYLVDKLGDVLAVATEPLQSAIVRPI